MPPNFSIPNCLVKVLYLFFINYWNISGHGDDSTMSTESEAGVSELFAFV